MCSSSLTIHFHLDSCSGLMDSLSISPTSAFTFYKSIIYTVPEERIPISTSSYIIAEISNRETKHHTQRVGELRFITLVGSEELTTPSSEPQTKGLQSFYRQTVVGNTSSNKPV